MLRVRVVPIVVGEGKLDPHVDLERQVRGAMDELRASGMTVVDFDLIPVTLRPGAVSSTGATSLTLVIKYKT